MTASNRPIGSVLRDDYDEADYQRLWRGVERRAACRALKRGLQRRARLATCVAATAVALIAAGAAIRSRQRADAGPLKMAQGGLPSTLTVAPGQIARDVAMEDGSSIRLLHGGRLDVQGNDGKSFLAVLRVGKAVFDVRPNGPRRWTIECGLATVDVLGTRFSCDRREDDLEVTVERGGVLVHGPRVPDGFRRLVAGGRIVIRAADRGPEEKAEAPRPQEANAGSSDGQGSSSPVATAIANPPRGPSVPSRSIQDQPIDAWLRRADLARREGDDALAVTMLERVVKMAPKDERASIAAFTLARLEIARDPRRAVDHLMAALSHHLPRGLEEDARARLVEAYARAGERRAAAAAAAEYERRFPTGLRRAEVLHWGHRD